MPKRTNRGQEIIALLRRLIAGDEAEIEESAILHDRVTGDPREVDAVWRPTVRDLAVTVSFEVIDWSRPASITWVEQQLNKHRTLETDRLVLVSWSGFTSTAARRAAVDPNVMLVTPEKLADGEGGLPRKFSLRLMETALTPTKVVAVVRRPDDSVVSINCPPDLKVFDDEGAEAASLQPLTMSILKSEVVMLQTFREARNHPEPHELVHFVLQVPLEGAALNLQWEETKEPHALLRLDISGDFVLKDQPVPLTLSKFKEVLFGYATTAIHDHKALLVATIGASGEIAKTTLRVYETQRWEPGPIAAP